MAADPYFNDVSLLLHCDGVDGDTSFTDSSNNGLLVNNVGNPVISSAQAAFAQSASIPNFADGLYIDDAALILNNDDYTLEFFAYQTADNTTGNCAIYFRENTTPGTPGIAFHLRHPAASNFPRLFDSGSSAISDGTTAFNLNQWYHVALVRISGVVKCYIGGAYQTQITSQNYTGNRLVVGLLASLDDNGFGFKGYIDEIRLTKGIARYTADFTPPIAPHPDYTAEITGTLSESLAATHFRAIAHQTSDGALVGDSVISTPAFTLPINTLEPVYVTLHPDQGTSWQASTTYALGDHCFPSDPITTPYYYVCTVVGTSGATEPTWPTISGDTVTDGTVTWQCVERLVQPITHGPLIPG